MARLRYVQRLDTPKEKGDAPSKVRHTVQSVRGLYETEPEIAHAVLPRPLEPAAPEVFVQFANVAMHLAEDRTVQIGAATVGIACTYNGQAGFYVLAMPMEGEFVVIGGRERYGEPKKIAQTEFVHNNDRINAKVTRHGVTFLELDGALGEPSASPKQFTEYFYCFKALPAAAAGVTNNGGFDGDVMLTRLKWERDYTSVRSVHDGRIILRESAHDPLVDVPVKRILRMEFAQGASKTSGEVIATVPGEYLSPFLVQRYDVPTEGIDIHLASEPR